MGRFKRERVGQDSFGGLLFNMIFSSTSCQLGGSVPLGRPGNRRANTQSHYQVTSHLTSPSLVSVCLYYPLIPRVSLTPSGGMDSLTHSYRRTVIDIFENIYVHLDTPITGWIAYTQVFA